MFFTRFKTSSKSFLTHSLLSLCCAALTVSASLAAGTQTVESSKSIEQTIKDLGEEAEQAIADLYDAAVVNKNTPPSLDAYVIQLEGLTVTPAKHKENTKRCLDVEACKRMCEDPSEVDKDKTAVPCSSATYDLKKLCHDGCHLMKDYLTPLKSYTVDQDVFNPSNDPATLVDITPATISGQGNKCDTYVACMELWHEQKKWPFRCAHIYCAEIDPTDAMKTDEELEKLKTELIEKLKKEVNGIPYMADIEQKVAKLLDDLPPEFNEMTLSE